ncbi:MAG TPA: isopentenyl-diphosphate delta-isomerase [Flavobacteriaceae bacterium]|nr:isopentenyl-diphosphate delta-isomerase [Flavobacteriaceae bacterium]
MTQEHVILVNERDQPQGTMEKMEAHQKAVLHRAFSVFIFNQNNELMLQQRALHKYHSPGLWTNTCCSHQRMGEDSVSAGMRRLREEMGFQTTLIFKGSFIYKAPFDNGLTEHELDHILVGHYDGEPQINPDEVASWRWISMKNLKKDIGQNPDLYTVWFKIIFEKYRELIS